MTYDSAHKKLTVTGNLFGGLETFSFSIRGMSDSTPPTQADVDAFEAPLRTFFTASTTAICSQHNVTEIKLAPIGLDGRYPPGTDSVVKSPSPAMFGGGASSSHFPQLSMALSMTTALPRGRAHLGRIYLPPLGSTVLPVSGLIDNTTVTQVLANWKTLLDAINALAQPFTVAVMSNVGAGTHQLVTGVRAGRVMDTQRRRRRSMIENPLSLALA